MHLTVERFEILSVYPENPDYHGNYAAQRPNLIKTFTCAGAGGYGVGG